MRCILYYDPQNPRSEERGFFICAASDKEVLAMLEMKLRQGANDVMLAPNDACTSRKRVDMLCCLCYNEAKKGIRRYGN